MEGLTPSWLVSHLLPPERPALASAWSFERLQRSSAEVEDVFDDDDGPAVGDTWTDDRKEVAEQRLSEQASEAATPNEKLSQRVWLTKTRRYWERFYDSHTTHFFKDRHYLVPEFASVLRRGEVSSVGLRLLDFGCGVGNACLPLLQRLPHVSIVAFDLSSKAVAMLSATAEAERRKGASWPRRLELAFAHDASTGALPSMDRAPCARGGFDAALMLFVLSAVPPGKPQVATLRAARDALRPGGFLLFRDYALYDIAQLRFHGGRRIELSGSEGVKTCYARGDGTLSYFFAPEELAQLAMDAGLAVVDMRLVLRQVTNRSSGTVMRRVWLHAVFQRPTPFATASQALLLSS
jgi:SAM-dependent methyltransferase